MKFKEPRISVITALSLVVSVSVFVYLSFFRESGKIYSANEVPIAFWAWRSNTPTQAEIHSAFSAVKGKDLFIRAGQLDIADGSVTRIRAVAGAFPESVDIHLVYNGTRDLLRNLESIDPETIAQVAVSAYLADLEKASESQANVVGIQLDLDFPTRLLPRYAELLLQLKIRLPSETTISITGLPTWADSNDLSVVLDSVDFWIPQIYGSAIPTRLDLPTPVSSKEEIVKALTRIRRLERPFFAGLSAYGYAILYDKDGDLIEVRGDIDQVQAEASDGLALVKPPVNLTGDAAGELRYVYTARTDLIIEGLIVDQGETLVFDLPTTSSLRQNARAVRENAGEFLLGICIFRLPTV